MFFIIKIAIYLLIGLAYLFHSSLGHHSYAVLGGLYATIVLVSIIKFIMKKMKKMKKKKKK